MLPLSAPPENICIVRLSALGDVTHAVPVLRAIQQNWPRTRITWICASLEHKLLSAIDGVRFIVLDKKGGWKAYRNLRRELAGEKFDIMLQMQTSTRANITGACVKANIKLGWDKFRARDYHRLFMTHAIPQTRQQHQVQGHLSFARTIGLDAREPVWDFPIADEAIAFAESVLPATQRILLISPCSSHPWRNWRNERYAAVADYAVERHGMAVVLSGGPSEFEQASGEAIEAAMKNPVINLVGKDTLPQLVALLKRVDIVLCPDTGPAHLASALGTPVIGLHACTWSKRSGPYHSLHLCVDKFAEAARRYRNKEPQQLRWGTRIEMEGVMDLVEVDAVIERLDSACDALDD
ncbi:MAG: glycosyltransferase family 9 protein [Gammaproteobacteria bacterium]|nr:glycosyltransferase family 9 protein [Gammaproteobacteria bacterium]